MGKDDNKKSPRVPVKDADAELVTSVQVHREEPGKLRADAERLTIMTRVSKIEIEQQLNAMIKEADKKLAAAKDKADEKYDAYREHAFAGFKRMVDSDRDLQKVSTALSALFGVDITPASLLTDLSERRIYEPKVGVTTLQISVQFNMSVRVPMGKDYQANDRDDVDIDEETGQAYCQADTIDWPYKLSPADQGQLQVYREARKAVEVAEEELKELQARKKNSKDIVESMEAKALRMQLGADEEGVKLLPLMDAAVKAVVSGGNYLTLLGG